MNKTLISRYRFARYLTLGVLVVFVIATLIIGRTGLTSENMRYLADSLRFDALSGEVSFTKTVFESGESTKIGYYQNEIAVLTENGFSLVNQYGEVTFRDITRRQNPRMSVSDKYVLVYDYGGMSYGVFNSFDEVISETLDYSITGGVASDSGVYAVVTREAGYGSVIRVYNRSGSLIERIYKTNKYVSAISITPDGRYIVAVSLAESNGILTPELFIDDINGKKDYTATISSGMPLSVRASDGGITVLTSSDVYFYNYRGNQISALSFDSSAVNGGVPSRFSYSDFGAAVLFENGADYKNRVIAFDNSGSILFSRDLGGDIADILLTGRSASSAVVYVLRSSDVLTVNRSGVKDTVKIAPTATGLFEADGKPHLIYGNYITKIEEAAK